VPAARSVLDPWNGSGTTTFVCAKNGIEAYGNDLSPVANIIATARSCSAATLCNLACLNNSENELTLGRSKYVKLTDGLYLLGAKWLDQTNSKFHLQQNNALILSALFRLIRRYTARIKLNNPTWIPEEALYRIVLRCDCLANLFVQELRIVCDAARRNSVQCTPTILEGPAQEIAARCDRKFNAIIVSPPYLTRLDYVRTVQAEIELLAKFVPIDVMKLRRSMTGSVLTNELPEAALQGLGTEVSEILSLIKNHRSKASKTYYCNFFARYFFDLAKSLKAMMDCSGSDAKWVLVVQSSFYKEIHIDLATIVSKMGADVGMIEIELSPENSAKNG
jgi:hypothetical protein